MAIVTFLSFFLPCPIWLTELEKQANLALSGGADKRC